MYSIKFDKKFDFQLDMDEFSVRYNRLLNSKKKNIIYIKDIFENSTFRYRAYNVMETMENSKKYCVHCFLVSELFSLYKLLDKIEFIVLQRAKWSFELESFITIVKDNNIKVIYDIDDLIYNTKYVPKYLNSIGDYREYTIDSFFALSKRYELVASSSDGFIVTTEKLKDNIVNDFNKPTWILNNYLNIEQEKESENIVNIKKNNYKNDKFLIGYFSGSNSHKRDLEVVESALIKLMDKYDDIYLKIVGYMDVNKELKKYVDSGRIFFEKFVPYQELQYEIGEVDLNIIPLQKNEFNSCKSELKYFEASVVMTPSIATNNEVYSNIIEDGVDGFLAGELDWFDKIEYVYLNRDKIDNIKKEAYNKCCEIYGNSKQLKYIEDMYDEIRKIIGG